jgi:hypothetical protein
VISTACTTSEEFPEFHPFAAATLDGKPFGHPNILLAPRRFLVLVVTYYAYPAFLDVVSYFARHLAALLTTGG